MLGKLVCALFIAATGMLSDAGAANPAELVMFEDPTCSWCRRWHAEIGPSYPRSAEGLQAPLRRVHIKGQGGAGVMLASPIRVTPTFVLVEDGREVGRIVGYPGADFFYAHLEELLKRLTPPERQFHPPRVRSTHDAFRPAAPA